MVIQRFKIWGIIHKNDFHVYFGGAAHVVVRKISSVSVGLLIINVGNQFPSCYHLQDSCGLVLNTIYQVSSKSIHNTFFILVIQTLKKLFF